MSFFEVLFWMGILCLAPVCFVVAHDALRNTVSLPGNRDNVDLTMRPAPIRA